MLKKINKLGQISIFIVIGIILIIVTVLLISNSNLEIFQSKETKMMNQVSEIVEDCIKTSGSQGIFLLGIQGGTIELSKTQKANPKSYVDLGFKIPSWEITPSQVPTINSMEEELSEHIKEKGYSCITKNLKALDDIFDFEYKDDLQIKSTISEKNVVIETNFPITFSEKNSEEKIQLESFLQKFENTNLGDIYDLATQIYSIELKNDILANLVLDQIYSASDYSSKDSMPSEGLSFSCSKRVWTKTTLKDNLVNLNNNNFKFLNFIGTYEDYSLRDIDMDLSYFDNFYTFELEDKKSSFENYKVEVFIPNSDVTKKGNFFTKDKFRTFEVTPSDGMLVQSTDMKVDVGVGKIPLPCVQLFHHLYTLDYDVIVKITDLSEDGSNLIFQYPLRIQIKNNAPSLEIPTIISFDKDKQLTATNSKFCSDEFRMYPTRIYALDKETGDIINGVNITYKCLSLSCDVGTTSRPYSRGIERRSADPVLKTDLAYCGGGTVIGEKEGYFSTKLTITTNDESLKMNNGYYNLDLIKTKSFTLNENTVLARYGEIDAKRIRDERDGSMYISIKNEKYGFSSQALWPTEEGILDELTFLDISSETIKYDVSVILVNEENELNGIFELKDWEPEVNSGNTMKINIPASYNNLQEEEFMSFYETSNNLVSEGESGFGDYFGIKFE